MKSCLKRDKRLIYPVLTQLNDDPVVTKIEKMLLPEECDLLMKKSGKYRRSETTGGGVDAYRTSSTSRPDKKDTFVKCLGKRLATIATMPDNIELQVTRYTNGQQYKPHHDDKGSLWPRREKTLFAYLDDTGLDKGKCGGATCFNRIRKDGKHLKVYPHKGDAVMWSNFTRDGRPDYRTEHSGEKVTCPGARKIGLNAWFQRAAGAELSRHLGLNAWFRRAAGAELSRHPRSTRPKRKKKKRPSSAA